MRNMLIFSSNNVENQKIVFVVYRTKKCLKLPEVVEVIRRKSMDTSITIRGGRSRESEFNLSLLFCYQHLHHNSYIGPEKYVS